MDAYATNNIPLLAAGSDYGAGSEAGVGLGADSLTTVSDRFYADQHGLTTLGIRLSAGRWFNAEEISDLDPTMIRTRPWQ